MNIIGVLHMPTASSLYVFKMIVLQQNLMLRRIMRTYEQ